MIEVCSEPLQTGQRVADRLGQRRFSREVEQLQKQSCFEIVGDRFGLCSQYLDPLIGRRSSRLLLDGVDLRIERNVLIGSAPCNAARHHPSHLDCLNKDVKHRADGYGILHDEDSSMRLSGAVLVEEDHGHRDMLIEAFGQIDTARIDPLPGIITLAARPMSLDGHLQSSRTLRIGEICYHSVGEISLLQGRSARPHAGSSIATGVASATMVCSAST